jgi:excinuclease ABC subunit C
VETNAAGFEPTSYLASLTTRPGVYQMFDTEGELLYVGKAKNLKNRVSSYFRARGLSAKTVALVNKIARIEVTVTRTETEALLLEHNLIRTHKPPYNILLRDDKSFPYVFLSDGEWPRLSVHRGARKATGRYFGPYPNVAAVRQSLEFLQKVFQVRQCEDSYFANRTRPCLQYQIGRCLGPCTDRVSREDYAQAVEDTVHILEGKSQDVTKDLIARMEDASMSLAFERAAEYRDRVNYLRHLQESQYVSGDTGDIDVLAVVAEAGHACIQHLYIRNGQVLGSRSHFPKLRLEEPAQDILSNYIAQRYLASDSQFTPPKEIFVNCGLDEKSLLEDALSQHLKRRLAIRTELRGERQRWLNLAVNTAQQNLMSVINDKQNVMQRFESLRDVLQWDDLPKRLECFDISHSSGELTVASCVVFDTQGPLKSDYRRFNIKDITPGDDYAAMNQAIERRYRRKTDAEQKLPDLLVIDGGKGQVGQAEDALRQVQVSIPVIGIAKGTTRKAGFETLICRDGDVWRESVLPSDHPALHLLQHIRDEAHRFAITGHRQRRGKKRQTSSLESIPGIGPKRRKELLNHFGGIQGVQRASVEELQSVASINTKMAQDIYDALHTQ